MKLKYICAYSDGTLYKYSMTYEQNTCYTCGRKSDWLLLKNTK